MRQQTIIIEERVFARPIFRAFGAEVFRRSRHHIHPSIRSAKFIGAGPSSSNRYPNSRINSSLYLVCQYPSALLGHPKFTSWYPGQEQAFKSILDWLSGPERFLCASMPTGSGKSLESVLAAHLGNRSTIILTVTKGLQAQLNTDFKQVGMKDIRGQNNYQCVAVDPADRYVSVEDGACHSGVHCPYRMGGCLYYDQVGVAKDSRLLVTNYAYYLAQTCYGDGLGKLDLLVCDEAHLAFQALESHLTLLFGNSEIQQLGIPPPIGFERWEEWIAWGEYGLGMAKLALKAAEDEIEEYIQSFASDDDDDDATVNIRPPTRMLQAVKHYKNMVGRLESLVRAKGRWIWQPVNTGWRLTPVWPGQQAGILYGKVPKVLLMSATFNEKTADSLAVPEDDRRWLDVPSYFPARQSPIAHYKTIRMNNKTTDGEMRVWVAHIDQLISKRLDRKGIVFTVSYDRRNFLMAQSEYRHLMVTHARDNVYQVVEAFKLASPPRILVSPTVTSGWDFPGVEGGEYAIQGKIPYPDSRDPVVEARLEDDKDWTSYIAMTVMEQSAGRLTRSVTDAAEFLIVDDNWMWFRKRYGRFASKWFHDRVIAKTFDLVPGPLV